MRFRAEGTESSFWFFFGSLCYHCTFTWMWCLQTPLTSFGCFCPVSSINTSVPVPRQPSHCLRRALQMMCMLGIMSCSTPSPYLCLLVEVDLGFTCPKHVLLELCRLLWMFISQSSLSVLEVYEWFASCTELSASTFMQSSISCRLGYRYTFLLVLWKGFLLVWKWGFLSA